MDKTDRDLMKLDQNFRLKVLQFLQNPRIKELGVFVTEAYRSQERQEWLYESGRTRPGKILTWTLDSNHTKGIAIDIAFHGKELYPSNPKIWDEVYGIARMYGIKSLYQTYQVDRPHLEDVRNTPPQTYINLQFNMEEIVKKQIEALLAFNSATYHLTDDIKFQEKLHEMNNFIREEVLSK